MSGQSELAACVGKLEVQVIDAVHSHWLDADRAQNPISKFDSLSKGWDRLAAEIWPEDPMGHRFKKLTGLCTSAAWSRSIDYLLSEVGAPIRNDLERLEKDAQKDFDRAKKKLRQHRDHQLEDKFLMEAVGSLLWTVRSNSMHGRKTTSGPVGPTNRDEQICGLGAVVLGDLYGAVFPAW